MSMPRLSRPVVFIHGLCGFDYLRLGRWRFASYWSKLPEAVRAAGNRVYVARVAPMGSVADRARQLRAFLDQHCPNEPVHLVAHSMGGLDSRYMISRLDMQSRVLSLTTLGTPHGGTPFADWGLRRLMPIFRAFLDLFGISPQAIEDLTVAACRRFNDEVLDAPGVRYYSVAGQFESSWWTPIWQMSYHVIRNEAGDNDGLVPVSSAAYRPDTDHWQGDHVSLIGRNRISAYAGLLRRLVPVEA
jgi:triacylglycerol lipase